MVTDKLKNCKKNTVNLTLTCYYKSGVTSRIRSPRNHDHPMVTGTFKT